MEPSQWGHPSIEICHSPPCIYARTLKASKVTPPTQTHVEASWAQVVADAPQTPSNPAADRVVKLLLTVGGKTQLRKLALFLSDGKKRSTQEIVDAVGYPYLQVSTAINRLRSRPGVHIDGLSINRQTFYRMNI
jgi:hypothetical protein